jgi:hypothetical protein
MALGISSVANYIMNELHIIATLSQICFVSQFSVKLFLEKCAFWYFRKQDAKAEIKTDVGKNYFEGVNLTFIVWELKFLKIAFFQIILLFEM